MRANSCNGLSMESYSLDLCTIGRIVTGSEELVKVWWIFDFAMYFCVISVAEAHYAALSS